MQKLKVKLSSQDTNIEIEMTKTVADLKAKIKENFDTPFLLLEYDGECLKDDTVLDTIELKEGTCISQVILPDSFSLIIRMSDGEQHELTACPDMTVGDLKQRIKEKIRALYSTEELLYGVDPSITEPVFESTDLLSPDDTPLAYFSIRNGSSIFVINFGSHLMSLIVIPERGDRFTVEVSDSNDLSILRKLIKAYTNISEDRMILTHGDIELKGVMTLGHKSLRDGSEVKVTERAFVIDEQIEVSIDYNGAQTQLEVSTGMTGSQVRDKINNALIMQNTDYQLLVERNPDNSFSGCEIRRDHRLRDFSVTNGSVLKILHSETPVIPPDPSTVKSTLGIPDYNRDTSINIYHGNKTLYLRANVKHTIAHLKMMIKEKNSIRVVKQVLMKGQNVLDDDRDLESYGVQSKVPEYLILKVEEFELIKVANRDRTLELKVKPKTTVKELKDLVFKEIGLKSGHQVLCIAGRTLRDDEMADDLLSKMTEDDAIELQRKEAVVVEYKQQGKSFEIAYKKEDMVMSIQKQLEELSEVRRLDQIFMHGDEILPCDTKFKDIKKTGDLRLSLFDRSKDGNIELEVVNYCDEDFKLKLFPFDNKLSIEQKIREKRATAFFNKLILLDNKELTGDTTIGRDSHDKVLYIFNRIE